MSDAFKCNRCNNYFSHMDTRTRIPVDSLIRLITIPIQEPNVFDLCTNCREELENYLKSWWMSQRVD